MTTLAEKSHVTQNMGFMDRAVRLFIGVIIMGFAYFIGMSGVTGANLGSHEWNVWGSYAMVIALYPILTGMLGWEPLYAMFGVRGCDDAGRNQCGTLPYQFKALIGHSPKYCESDAEHSLEACHDEPEDHPHHKVWRVDEEPMLYPDDRAWHKYFVRTHQVEEKVEKK